MNFSSLSAASVPKGSERSEAVKEPVSAASTNPLAALREADWLVALRDAAEKCHEVPGDPERAFPMLANWLRQIADDALKATEPLIAENEELRRERDEWRRQAIAERDLVNSAAFKNVEAALIQAGTEKGFETAHAGGALAVAITLCAASEANAESARSTSEALAGALEKCWRKVGDQLDEDTADEVRDALDSARTPTATEFPSQEAMRSGPRSYTPEQSEVIETAVRSRRPLPAPPLPPTEENSNG